MIKMIKRGDANNFLLDDFKHNLDIINTEVENKKHKNNLLINKVNMINPHKLLDMITL